MRIIHVCNFNFNRSGDKFDGMDARIHHGLIENGHYVYPFPVQDISRQMTWTNSKRYGAKRANASLVETCRKLMPDLIMLGHSQLITRETLETIRKNQPHVKIAQWFCDWFYSKKSFQYEFLFDRIDLLDSLFLTTAGKKMEMFVGRGCKVTFFPNPVLSTIERNKSFESEDHDYDLVFIGRDHKDQERRAALQEIDQKLGGKFKIGIFGSLGRPGIHGYEKERVLSRSKAGLNLTRLPEPMKWYSSDRIASLMGNGLLTCTRAEADLHEIYGADSLVCYKDTQDLIEQLNDVLESGKWKEMAKLGWERNHELFNAKRVSAMMIDFIDGRRSDCLGIN